MYDIVLIGSGPNSLLFSLFISLYYPKIKLLILTKKFHGFHCTYGIFLDQIKNTWFFNLIKDNKEIYTEYNTKIHCPKNNEKLLNNKKNLLATSNYILFNNINFFNYLKNIISKNKNIEIIEKTVIDIKKYNNYTNVIFYNKNIINSIKTKLVIEAVGQHKSIGLKYKNSNVNYQVFLELN